LGLVIESLYQRLVILSWGVVAFWGVVFLNWGVEAEYLAVDASCYYVSM
jgi:hypothetical protein